MRYRLARWSGSCAAVAVLLLAFVVAVHTEPAAAAVPGPRTDSVLVQRSGGFAGRTESFLVDRATPGEAGARVLRLTAKDRFRALRGQYLPADPCCDRFFYTVVVRYVDGSAKTVTTVEGTPSAPRLLWDVIRLTIAAGTPAHT